MKREEGVHVRGQPRPVGLAKGDAVLALELAQAPAELAAQVAAAPGEVLVPGRAPELDLGQHATEMAELGDRLARRRQPVDPLGPGLHPLEDERAALAPVSQACQRRRGELAVGVAVERGEQVAEPRSGEAQPPQGSPPARGEGEDAGERAARAVADGDRRCGVRAVDLEPGEVPLGGEEGVAALDRELPPALAQLAKPAGFRDDLDAGAHTRSRSGGLGRRRRGPVSFLAIVPGPLVDSES